MLLQDHIANTIRKLQSQEDVSEARIVALEQELFKSVEGTVEERLKSVEGSISVRLSCFLSFFISLSSSAPTWFFGGKLAFYVSRCCRTSSDVIFFLIFSRLLLLLSLFARMLWLIESPLSKRICIRK